MEVTEKLVKEEERSAELYVSLREGLCRGNQGGGCHGCHEGRHVGEGGGGQSHEDGS